MKRLHSLAWALVPTVLLAFSVTADHHENHKRSASPKGAKSYIVQPKDGRTINRKKVKVIFGLTGMGICPAGIVAEGGIPIPNTGHHHLLVDVDKLPPLDVPLPSDQPDHIKHYGAGQTEAVIELTPGKHTLQLILADFAHVPHDPPVISKKITIHVAE